MPTAVLFGQVWQQISDERAQVALEKKGLEYITALAPLVSALVESESTALQGVTDPPDSLSAAVSRVSALDASLGDELKTKERWADLQAKIAELPTANGGAVGLLQAHTEVTDLTLALYNAVRHNAKLTLDPDSDVSNLQQAVAVDMPTTVVLVSRMADYAQAVQTATGSTKSTFTLAFGEAVLAVKEQVNTLTDNLQTAVDNTSSSTLSGNLVTTLDSFRRAVESMNRGVNSGGTPNVATVSTAQTALQGALDTLAGTTLNEMADLLNKRSDELNSRRTEALLMGALAALLVVIALVLTVDVRRRHRDDTSSGGGTTGPGEPAHDIPANRAPAPAYGGQYDLTPSYGDHDQTWREQSGALR